MCLRHFSTIAAAHTVCCLFLEITSKFSVLLWAACHLYAADRLTAYLQPLGKPESQLSHALLSGFKIHTQPFQEIILKIMVMSLVPKAR